MSRFKRVLGLGFVAGLLSALAMAIPANASDVTAVCVVSGEAKTQDKEDSTLGVQLVGGKGSFTFSSLAIVCVGSAKGTPDAQVLGASASGVFVNQVCGTGKAWGTVTSLTGPTKYVNLIKGRKFAIHFAGSAGGFFWHTTKRPAAEPDAKDRLSAVTQENDPKASSTNKTWEPAGSIKLDAPTQKEPIQPPGTPPGNCTKAFTATGAVTVVA